MLNSSRPVIVLGHGLRLGKAEALIPRLMDLGVPVLTSWPAADLVDNYHVSYFGRPGVYGQRCANKVLAKADYVLAIGCRLSIWTAGYDFPRDDQRVVVVDVDRTEARKFPGATWIEADAKHFIDELVHSGAPERIDEWVLQCREWRAQYPWLEQAHQDGDYISPHRFMRRLQNHLSWHEIVVADCATGSLAAHQILRLKPPQRLMTSGGLGEMGCGLPAAIGASFANGKGRVICLNTDGSMMLNLQELQTIVHHDLPIKLVVFSNDGYGMIKDTQRNLGYQRAGVDARSGVSCPNFVRIATAFGIPAAACRDNPDSGLAWLFREDGPALLEVHIDPELVWAPKLRPTRNADGSITNAKFDEMSPAL